MLHQLVAHGHRCSITIIRAVQSTILSHLAPPATTVPTRLFRLLVESRQMLWRPVKMTQIVLECRDSLVTIICARQKPASSIQTMWRIYGCGKTAANGSRPQGSIAGRSPPSEAGLFESAYSTSIIMTKLCDVACSCTLYTRSPNCPVGLAVGSRRGGAVVDRDKTI